MSALIRPAPLARRLGAAFYDGLLLVALWMLASFVVVLANGGEAAATGDPVFRSLLLIIGAAFNGWFWTHGGQTLGMRAWRLQVRRNDGASVDWGRAVVRFGVAVPAWGLAGLGVIWSLLHPERKAWQDLLSGTETVLLPAPRPPLQTAPDQ